MPLKMYKSIGMGRSFLLSLSAGILFGFIFAYVLFSVTEVQLRNFRLIPRFESQSSYVDRHSHFDPESSDINIVALKNSDEMQHQDEDLIASRLKEKIRVLCWVMTAPQNHRKKAVHVKATWGKRCNTLLFMSSAEDEELPTVALPVGEGRNNLWGKTKEAFKYIHRNYNGTYDWVLKADDDTFVIVENLRLMLSNVDPAKPIYFGCRFKPFVKQGYMSGGAGYVLSKEAVRRYVEEALIDENCRQDSKGAEDIEIGKCLEIVGVEAGDSRDSLGRGRFFPFHPSHHLIPGHTDKSFWYWHYIYYPSEEGLNCCSDTAVSFHYISPTDMYVFDYFLYHLRPYGITHNSGEPNEKAIVRNVEKEAINGHNSQSEESSLLSVLKGNSPRNQNKTASSVTKSFK
ncbi:hypothetical protein V9T40_008442 [Parthenolecanium corni]|uniref:Glycoprotein-N-acetylgalactosamine 3-beta-galactosyltransferase 1 n=1 Tax=Parthenolecanium corni TaxID=536013 RepID=A0AAN9TN39_9HEMI